MTLSPQVLTLLVLIAVALSAFALLILASQRGPRRSPEAMPAGDRAVIRIEEHERAIARLRQEVAVLAEADAGLRELARGPLQRVGLVRYDAFEDMGGRLSFSLALLDGTGAGVVITSINGRSDTRCYAKPVVAGSSDHNLSEEEAEAIRRATAGTPVATA
jgi:hypothetical protein